MPRPYRRLPALDRRWRDHAACAGMDTDMWFPTTTGARPDPEAIALCRNCPVRVECLEYAIVVGEQYGVWGGLTAKQLRGIRKRRGLPPHARPSTFDTVTTCGEYHGTTTGARRHYRAGEPPCRACRRANNRDRTRYREAAE